VPGASKPNGKKLPAGKEERNLPKKYQGDPFCDASQISSASQSSNSEPGNHSLLWYHVECNQLGWVRALPKICFDLMNTVNKSTGFTPFQLHMGCSPHVIPPLVPAKSSATVADIDAWHVIRKLETDVFKAQGNLLKAKLSQAVQANKQCTLTFPFVTGSHVQLSTLHQRKEYKAKGEKHMAKFMPHYDGPYTIIDTDEVHSTVTLDLPNSPNIFPMFHTSQVIPYIESDTEKFPSRHFKEPEPIITDEGHEEQDFVNILFFMTFISDDRFWFFEMARGKFFQNKILTKSWMCGTMDGAISTWFVGVVSDKNTMNGYLALNWKIAKRSISGWRHGMDPRGSRDLNAGPGVGEGGGVLKLLKKFTTQMKNWSRPSILLSVALQLFQCALHSLQTHF